MTQKGSMTGIGTSAEEIASSFASRYITVLKEWTEVRKVKLNPNGNWACRATSFGDKRSQADA